MRQHADICLILEGTYPFVAGGVSSWAHELIQEQNHLNFHLLAIVPSEAELELKYQLPNNVIGLTTIRLGELPEGDLGSALGASRLHAKLREPITKMTQSDPVEFEQFKNIIQTLHDTSVTLGSHILLDREEAWEQLVELYETNYEEQSFLDFFWSYRAIVSGIYSMLLADLPSATVYHALSTGYAGLLAARAKIETGKPVMVTEHGIYTNERRIEVISASWLEATASKSLTIDKPRLDLRDLWIDTINNFSQLCYSACDNIITLFTGNQAHQLADGAAPEKMMVIPNGVDLNRYGNIQRNRMSTPTIALIGRVVPIKDIKSYIRAVSMLKQYVPDIKAYIMGPTDEDEHYYEECKTMVGLLQLEDNIEFTGRVDVTEYLPFIDVLVLTSLSESQPLVMLEAGACGIPLVSTDVGSCREIIEGVEGDDAALGHGGFIADMASPQSIAECIYGLLSDADLYAQCSASIKQRIHAYYDLNEHQSQYRDLYARYLDR